MADGAAALLQSLCASRHSQPFWCSYHAHKIVVCSKAAVWGYCLPRALAPGPPWPVSAMTALAAAACTCILAGTLQLCITGFSCNSTSCHVLQPQFLCWPPVF